MSSQDFFINERMDRFSKLKKAVALTKAGQKVVYPYKSLAVKEAIELRNKESKIPVFHQEFRPQFTNYQYDLELYIFFHYEELYNRELELTPSGEKRACLLEKGISYGATLLTRQEHLQNAILIRWPEKELKDGSISTTYALTPWAKDYLYGLSNYTNIVTFGGGGQGKTYSALAMAVMTYDFFYYTKSGAQCSASTVSEKKLKSSIWSHVNKLYSFKNDYRFSDSAGSAHIAPEYTYRRKDTKNKYIEEGGTLTGVLLVQGAKTARQIDKLTGQHDVEARIYLLDEAQSTGAAPLQAYNNMFLHPKWGWFLMAGNYELDEDLLGLNTIPEHGWDSVDEFTHMWEGTIKSPDSDLNHKSLVIHYNNDLSPAIVGENAKEMARKYGKFLPTLEKKRRLYKTKADEETYEAKRFWKGFRFEKKKENVEKVFTAEIAKSFGACDDKDFDTVFRIVSLDTAHGTERDRSLGTFLDIGLNKSGYPMVAPTSVTTYPKPNNPFTYYDETADMIVNSVNDKNVKSGFGIMDWTQRSQLLEGMRKRGFVCHHIIYQNQPAKVAGVNPITKVFEKPVELETIPTFKDGFEKSVKVFAHEKIANRITLGAYIFRLFVESGNCRNFNAKLIESIDGNKGFEKEMCLRYFTKHSQYKSGDMIILDSKEDFKKKHKFSPDFLDTIFQAFYFLYVEFGIRPDKPGLGSYRNEVNKKRFDNPLDSARMRFSSKSGNFGSRLIGR